MLIIKTRRSLQLSLTTFVQAHHPYDVPEVIFLPIQAGSPDYLAWLAKNTEGSAAAEPGAELAATGASADVDAGDGNAGDGHAGAGVDKGAGAGAGAAGAGAGGAESSRCLGEKRC